MCIRININANINIYILYAVSVSVCSAAWVNMTAKKYVHGSARRLSPDKLETDVLPAPHAIVHAWVRASDHLYAK